MFGIVRRKKPYVHAHWYVPLPNFTSDTIAFYEAIEEEIAFQEIPEVTTERIEFRQGNLLSGKRTYLRILRERVALDICSAPFGKGWFFSLRSVTLPRRIGPVQFWISIVALLAYLASCWHLFGLTIGGIVVLSSALALLLIFIAGRRWGALDEALVYLPVIGIYYERLRRDTFQQQDHRLLFADMISDIVRAKVDEFCAAGGVYDVELTKVHSPDQILKEKELVKFAYADSRKK